MTAHHLVYEKPLPKNKGSMTWYTRSSQKNAAVKRFGVLPVQERTPKHAFVTIIRVHGPRERTLDDDNLRLATKGIRDALKHGGYIVDDRPSCATFTYIEDSTRRHEGPRVEVTVTYAE